MSELLKPAVMQTVLTHDRRYIRAVGLLNGNWDPDDQPIYRDLLAASDVVLARQLQQATLIHGRVNLTDYQSVSQLLNRHPQWFSAGAQQALLKPFQE